MKQPASVTAAIVVLSLFSLASLYWVVAMFMRGSTASTIVYVVLWGTIAAPIYGLVARKNWARTYSCVLFALLAILMFVGNAGIAAQNNKVVIAFIYGAVIAGLLAWNVISLMSKDVKHYFAAGANAAQQQVQGPTSPPSAEPRP